MKTTAVAKHPAHAKAAKATKKKTSKARSKAAKSTKHKATAATSKHAAHEAHLKHLHQLHEEHLAHEKKVGLSLAEGVECCAAEALAASLRLAGGVVSDDDVLELHWRAGGTADDGVSILAALEAAQEYGIGAFRLVSFGCVKSPYEIRAIDTPLILGLELPGPHAALAEPGRWWSWGKRYDPAAFPGAVIEEAWAVSWA